MQAGRFDRRREGAHNPAIAIGAQGPGMLQGIQIHNYRVFDDVEITGFRRLNLIVGENNVGKSAFLEALWLLENGGDKEVALDILALRGEVIRAGLHLEAPKDYARSPFSTFTPWPPLDGQDTFKFSINSVPGNKYPRADVIISMYEYHIGTVVFQPPSDWMDDCEKIQLNTLSATREFWSKRGDNVFVPVSGLSGRFIQEFWDRITLTEHEDDIDAAVQLLEPAVQRISMTSTGPVVKMRGAPAPVPLRRLGDGMNRLFALALAMVNAKGGVLLIDEIETGFHRASLDRMWPFLFTLAERFNVQLFATTHSWDCIASFAAAAKATPEDDGALIRLERKGDRIVAVHYDEQTLAIATEQGIEVR